MTDDDAVTLAAPRSLADLFFSFNRLALQGFGGVLAVAQIELVERKRWLTREQFVDLLSVAQVLPGPNVVNLSLMLGDRFFGLRGALVASAGLMLVPLAIVLVLASLYTSFSDRPAVSGALRGMGAVAAGLVLSTALKLLGSLRNSPLGMPQSVAIAALGFIAVALLRWPLAGVILGLGGVACVLAWHKLSP